MMKKLSSALLLLTLAIAGCKKDDKPDPVADVNYQPLTTGSTWVYESTNNNTSPATKVSYAVTVKGTDTVVNGKTYRVFNNTSGGNDYYYKNGKDYYQYGQIAGISANTELHYLKSDAAVGATWQESQNVTIPGIGPASVKLTYTLVEKTASMAIEGNTYTDVLHVKVDLSDVTVSSLPVTITTQDIHFYYAANVGRIKSQVRLTITPPIGSQIITNNETSLKTAVIVP